MNAFWSSWLKVWCWGVLAFGVVLATAALPGIDGLVRTLFVAFGGDAASFDLKAVRFGLGLQGALTIGWGLTLLPVVSHAHALGPGIWRALTAAVLVWYVIDSAISVQTGFALNAVSNTLLTAAFLAPMVAGGALARSTTASR
ncbi:MAG: hypothetical protein AB7O98_13450 [Hyphomonadaceae bacterium]